MGPVLIIPACRKVGSAEATGFTCGRLQLTNFYVPFGVAMNRFLVFFRHMITVLSVVTFASTQQAERTMTSAKSDSSPEIESLVKTFGGEWKVEEHLERSEFFPNGALARELRE